MQIAMLCIVITQQLEAQLKSPIAKHKSLLHKIEGGND